MMNESHEPVVESQGAGIVGSRRIIGKYVD